VKLPRLPISDLSRFPDPEWNTFQVACAGLRLNGHTVREDGSLRSRSRNEVRIQAKAMLRRNYRDARMILEGSSHNDSIFDQMASARAK
jgi:hypothetical protein